MKTFRILHIADLHPKLKPGPEDQMIIQASCQHVTAVARDKRIDLIAATGDLGHQGSAQALKKGFKQLKDFRQHARVGTATMPRVIVTPGNHDVSWPPSLSKLGSWPSEDRFHNFINCCDPRYYRPLLTPHDKDVINTLRKKPNPRWYFTSFSDDLCIFILPLSSADLGGSPVESELLDKVTDKAKLAKGIAPGLLKVLTCDIPYVDMAQFTYLEHLITEWSTKDASLHEAFQRAVKIAVVHHPLLPVPGEQELRPFDTVANGANVATKLSTLGFQLVLYGHKHRLGCHVNSGLWENHFSEDGEKDMGEIACAVGGHLIVGRTEALEDERGFSVISIRLDVDSDQPRTTIDLVTHSGRGEGWGSRERRRLLTLDVEGRIRWTHRGTDDSRHLSRQAEIAKDFGRIVKNIEENFVAAKNEGWLGKHEASVDDLLKNALRVMEQYTEGTRGVDHPFIARIQKAALTAGAMYFVDVAGHGTWNQPDLLEHLSILFRAVLARNTSVTDGRWLDGGTWRHSPEVQQARIRLQYCEDDAVRQEEAQRRDSHEQLKFDMSRILMWDKADLARPPGQTLIRLHDVFDVPLFWLDLQVWKEEFIGEVAVDYHLEWASKRNTDPRPVNETDNPDQAWLLPPGQKKRQEVKRERSNRWSTYRHLLRHEELRLARDVD